MFRKFFGGGTTNGGSTAVAAPAVNPAPNIDNPVPPLHLAPFPFTGEQVADKGYLYTTPSLDDFAQFRKLLDSTGSDWVLRYDRDGIFAWDKTLPNEPMRVIKAFSVFENVAPGMLYDLLHDPDYRIQWDQNRLDASYLAHLKTNVDISYYAAKVRPPISNRDFVNMRSWVRVDDGEFVIMSTSVPHVDMPERRGCVRGAVKVSGYLIRPYGTNGCSLTYLSQSDPKGWVPSSFINGLTSKLAPNVVISMRNALAKYPAWIAEQGEAHQRPWLQDEGTVSWPEPMPNKLHDWVQKHVAGGDAATPVVAQPDDEADAAEDEQPAAACA